MQKITPCLWFESQAEEAVSFYLSVFKDSKITDIERYNHESAKASGQEAGSVMTIIFTLNGNEFMALNGGPVFKFTPAISFMVSCENQEEVNWFWDMLSEGGEEQQCGWLTDKYGVSWQIVPIALAELMGKNDPKKSENLMKALIEMKKIDIDVLKKAYYQE